VPSQGWDTFDIQSGKSIADIVNEADVPEAARARAKEQCFCDTFAGPSVQYFGDHPFDAIAMLSNPAPYNYQLFPVVLPTVPAVLARYANVPAGVVRWNANTKHAPVSGVSIVSGDNLLDAFRKK
jgi:hypothetical protein